MIYINAGSTEPARRIIVEPLRSPGKLPIKVPIEPVKEPDKIPA
jgi:hypothetical protein